MNHSPIPFFSICIPAYKNADFVYRLLQSIINQSFSNYEIIVTDDSPDDCVKSLVAEFKERLSIKYFRNQSAAGTPANWNIAISKANGKWIKLMHHDDWFNTNEALDIFKKNTEKYSDCNFFYCAYNNVNESKERQFIKKSWLDILLLKLSIFNILRKNVIGNPSCILIKNDRLLYYDEKLKWLVDIDYYIMYVSKHKNIKYIPKALVNVGLNIHQVTHTAFRNPAVELPENFWLLEKYGTKILKNIIVYDHYWRLIRNLNIKSEHQVSLYYNNNLESQITKIIRDQSHYSNKILSIGILSKFLMAMSYIKFRISS